MIKDLLERFKRVFTVAEWKREAQDAMRNKEFVVASLAELHRVEKAENGGISREQVQSRKPSQSGRAHMQQKNTTTSSRAHNPVTDASLKELMDAVRQQQVS